MQIYVSSDEANCLLHADMPRVAPQDANGIHLRVVDV